MSGNSIGFGEEIKKLCQKMCSVRMLIWRAGKHCMLAYIKGNDSHLQTFIPLMYFKMLYSLKHCQSTSLSCSSSYIKLFNIQSNFHISNTDISKFSVYRSFSQVPTFFLHNLYEKTANISKLYISKFSVYRSFFTSPNVHLHPNSPFIYRIPLTCTNFSRKYCEGFSHLSFADRKNKGPT